MGILKMLTGLIVLAAVGLPLMLSHVAAGWVAIRTSNWYPDAGLSDLAGKVALVTGASTGIGRTSAVHLAKKGARVLVHGRSSARADPVVQEIRDAGGQAEAVLGDLSDFASAAKMADDIAAKLGSTPLDIAILNAGLCKDCMGQTDEGFELTADGFELHIQVNHLAHQLLTEKLLKSGQIKAGATRVVSVSSALESKSYPEGMRYNDWKAKGVEYKDGTAYSQSKLANVMMAAELHKRHGVASVSVHPGIIATDLGRHRQANADFAQKMFFNFFMLAVMTAEQGSYSQLWAATAPGLSQGFYWPVGRERTPHEAFTPKNSAECWDKSHAHIASYL